MGTVPVETSGASLHVSAPDLTNAKEPYIGVRYVSGGRRVFTIAVEAVNPPNTPVGFVLDPTVLPTLIPSVGRVRPPAVLRDGRGRYRIRRRNMKRNSSTAFETFVPYTLTGTNGPPRWTIDHSDLHRHRP